MDHPNIKNRPRKLMIVEVSEEDKLARILNKLGAEWEEVPLRKCRVSKGEGFIYAPVLTGELSLLNNFYEAFKGHNESLICSIRGKRMSISALEVLKGKIIPLSQLFVADVQTVELLTGSVIRSFSDAERVGPEILRFGAKSMLLWFRALGSSSHRQALFCEGDKKFWLTSEKTDSGSEIKNTVRIAAAVAGGMSLGLNTRDSVVLGMSTFNNFTRGAIGGIEQRDLPWINGSAEDGDSLYKFQPLDPAGQVVYPIVDSSKWVERLVSLGVKTLQLRIKGLTGSELEGEIKKSIEISNKFGARLFVNDYWELAIKYSAYGVHLGQDDLLTADIRAIERAGLRLGVSTHCYFEAAVAHGLRPSYIAFGPIYHTELKSMEFAPQGIENLKTWRTLFDCPIVAIGGITLERAEEVLLGEPDYISVVRDITLSKTPDERVRSWLEIG